MTLLQGILENYNFIIRFCKISVIKTTTGRDESPPAAALVIFED
jgi:hypothetical protein